MALRMKKTKKKMKMTLNKLKITDNLNDTLIH